MRPPLRPRRPTLRIALGTTLAAALVCGCGRSASEPAARNAVLICLDTVRADSFELAQAQETPGARAHWERAASLTRAQSVSPWTLPAVGSALTGLRPERHGLGSFRADVANLERELPGGLDAATPTLAEHLHAQGFETVGVFAHPWLRKVGVDRGFETWTYLPGFDSRPRIAAEALRWLGARDPARRFFLYVHWMDAHQHPFLPPATREERIATLAPAQQAQLVATAPGGVCEREDALYCRQYLAYSAAVAQLRQTVSGLLDALERSGELDETIVVLFADHGEEFLDHTEIEAELAYDPRGTYGIGHGHSLFGELLRVPLRVWHPDATPGPSAAPASVVDIAPTLLDYLGVPGMAGDGQSLRPALEGGGFDPERPLYAGALAFGPRLTAVVRGSWKGIAGDGMRSLYYDLAHDPRERTPRADPGGVADLIAAHGAQGRSASAPLSLDDESVRALQAIGYLEQAPDDSEKER